MLLIYIKTNTYELLFYELYVIGDMIKMHLILIFKVRGKECKSVANIVEKSKKLDFKDVLMMSKLSHIQYTLR